MYDPIYGIINGLSTYFDTSSIFQYCILMYEGMLMACHCNLLSSSLYYQILREYPVDFTPI